LNFKKLSITLTLIASIAGTSMATDVKTVSASTPSFPVHMRGTWHSYGYGHFDTIKITKHSFHYYGDPKIEPWDLEVGHVRYRNGRIGYVPRWIGQDAAYSDYGPTTVSWHDHHYRALICNDSSV